MLTSVMGRYSCVGKPSIQYYTLITDYKYVIADVVILNSITSLYITNGNGSMYTLDLHTRLLCNRWAENSLVTSAKLP